MGHELISFCKTCSFGICNGRLGSDFKVGELTCKDASVVDYIILSLGLFSYVLDFNVHEFNPLYSDVHNAVSISFSFSENPNILNITNEETKCQNNNYRYVRWTSNEAVNFNELINNEQVLEIESELDSLIARGKDISSNEIITVVEKVDSIFLNTATELNMIKVKHKNKLYKPNKNPWFDENCKLKRNILKKAKRRAHKHKCNFYFQEQYKLATKEYKKQIEKVDEIMTLNLQINRET